MYSLTSLLHNAKQATNWVFVLPDDLIGGGAQQALFIIINYFIKHNKTCTVVFNFR
ncbi:hypothetical protein [Psychroserpens mesophilus]|uniref:hypothetical protein n=1 Tax=Psychroserpens mesophilus TaxID=325473 RepID=UPI003D651790